MSTQQIYPDMSREQRKKAMAAAAYKVEYEEYQTPLPSDELSAENDSYARRAIELSKLKVDFATYKRNKAAEIKAVEAEMEIQLQVIKTGKREAEGNLYMFQDLQKNDMNYYDVNGMLIRTRKIRPEERQTTIFLGETDVEGAHGKQSDAEIEENTEDAVAVEVVELANVQSNAMLTPEEEEGLMAYLDLEKNATPAQYLGALEAYINDPTQVITDDRMLVLNQKMRELANIIEAESATTHGINQEGAAVEAYTNHPGEDVGGVNLNDEVADKIKNLNANKKRISKKQQIEDAAAQALIPDNSPEPSGGEEPNANPDEDFELE